MSTPALQHVSYKYEGSGRTIFEDVSMCFETGKVYTIAGKSSSGKSTLLNLLAGPAVATTGHITYVDEVIVTRAGKVLSGAEYRTSSPHYGERRLLY